MKDKKTNPFQNKYIVPVFASTAALAWAAAFPLIKMGISYFSIAPNDTGAKTLFAGIRFFFAGVLVLIISAATHRNFKIGGKKQWGMMVLFGIVNTALHYFFFYLGLSNSTGSRSAILDSLGTFLLIIFACIFFKGEKMTVKKIIGCLLGFGGILLVNAGSSLQESGAFTLKGDGMIFCSSVRRVRRNTHKNSYRKVRRTCRNGIFPFNRRWTSYYRRSSNGRKTDRNNSGRNNSANFADTCIITGIFALQPAYKPKPCGRSGYLQRPYSRYGRYPLLSAS